MLTIISHMPHTTLPFCSHLHMLLVWSEDRARPPSLSLLDLPWSIPVSWPRDQKSRSFCVSGHQLPGHHCWSLMSALNLV